MFEVIFSPFLDKSVKWLIKVVNNCFARPGGPLKPTSGFI